MSKNRAIWIAEEEARIVRLEQEWEELTRQYVKDMRATNNNPDVRKHYQYLEEMNERAKLDCINRIHRYKLTAFVDELDQ